MTDAETTARKRKEDLGTRNRSATAHAPSLPPPSPSSVPFPLESEPLITTVLLVVIIVVVALCVVLLLTNLHLFFSVRAVETGIETLNVSFAYDFQRVCLVGG